MTTDHHTPIPDAAPVNASVFNDPLSALDEVLTEKILTKRNGHIIADEDDILPARQKLNFIGGGVSISDDPENDATIIERLKGDDYESRYRNLALFEEFFRYSAEGSGTASELSSGSDTYLLDEPNHPGILRVSSAAGAASGIRYTFGKIFSFVILLQGKLIFEVIFRCPTTTDINHRLGFQDQNTPATSVVDGAWINIEGNVLDGRTSNNSSASTTGGSYTIAANEWYRAKIVLNDDATRVDFYLFSEDGEELFHDYLDSNIPTEAGRNCGLYLLAYKNSAGSANIFDADWAGFYTTSNLNR